MQEKSENGLFFCTISLYALWFLVAWKISTEIISFILQELDIILESLPPWTIGPFDAWRAILSQTRGRSKN